MTDQIYDCSSVLGIPNSFMYIVLTESLQWPGNVSMVMLMLLQIRKLRLRGWTPSAHTMQLVSGTGVSTSPADSLACTLISPLPACSWLCPRVTMPFPFSGKLGESGLEGPTWARSRPPEWGPLPLTGAPADFNTTFPHLPFPTCGPLAAAQQQSGGGGQGQETDFNLSPLPLGHAASSWPSACHTEPWVSNSIKCIVMQMATAHL